MNQIQIQLTCPNGTAHSVIEDEEAGEKVCEKCGIVLEENMTAIGNQYGIVQVDKAQSGVNLGRTTMIKKGNLDANGNRIAFGARQSIKQIQRMDNSIKARANNGDKARDEMVSRFCEKLSLKMNVQQDVHTYMLKSSKAKLMRGRETIDILAATIYYVCKIHEIPKSMAEVGEETNVTTKRIFRMLRLLNEIYGTIQKIQPLESYVPQYATKAGMPLKYQSELLRLVEKVKTNKYQEGKTPAVIIGSLLRWISINVGDFPSTLEELSEACDTNDVSIRQNLQDMIKVLPLVWVY